MKQLFGFVSPEDKPSGTGSRRFWLAAGAQICCQLEKEGVALRRGTAQQIYLQLLLQDEKS